MMQIGACIFLPVKLSPRNPILLLLYYSMINKQKNNIIILFSFPSESMRGGENSFSSNDGAGSNPFESKPIPSPSEQHTTETVERIAGEDSG